MHDSTSCPIPYNPADDRCLVRNFFICRAGFLQPKGGAHTGMTRIVGELSHRFGGHENRVEAEAWNVCPRQSAEYIYRLGRKGKPPNVCIFAYSWGCGYGFVNLARELGLRGIPVHTAVLCDPVYHGLDFWRAMIPRTLFRKIKVPIPPNVYQVHWFRQRQNRPAGHDLYAEGSYTKIHPPVELQCTHQEADNSIEFRQKCLAVASEIVSK